MLAPAKTVEELLKVDESCATSSKVIFNQLGATCSAQADLAIVLYSTAIRAIDELTNVQAHEDKITSLAEKAGISKQDLGLNISKPPTATDSPELIEARATLFAAKQVMAVKVLVQITARAYRWAITDLRRLRITPASGYLRVQVESICRMFIFLKRQDLALRFLDPNDDGQQLFWKLNKKVNKLLDEHDLRLPYEMGSKIAQHPNFASVARGMKIGDGKVESSDQEFEPDHPYNFHQVLTHFLRTQIRIFDLLTLVFPSLEKDRLFAEQIAEYKRLDVQTWDTMTAKYRNEIADAYRRAGK